MRKLRSCLHLIIATPILFLPMLFGPVSSSWGAPAEEERTAKLIEGAKKEGRFVWYTQMGATESLPVLRKFEEKYPFIKGELFAISGSKLLTRILAEVASGTYKSDVVSVNGFHLHVLKKRGLFEKYPSPQALSYPEGAKDPDGYGTSIYLNVKGIAYNTRLVAPKDVPKSFEDLLDPKWRGKKIVTDDSEDEWFANMLKILGREKGLDLMKKIALQQPQLRSGSSLRATLLAAGEFSLVVPANGDVIERFKAKGAEIEWVGLEPVIALKHMAAFTARSPHPNAAKLFIDYILSKEGQGVLVELNKIPARIDIEPKAARLRKGFKLYYSEQSLADNIDEIGRESVEIFRGKKR